MTETSFSENDYCQTCGVLLRKAEAGMCTDCLDVTDEVDQLQSANEPELPEDHTDSDPGDCHTPTAK